MILRVLLIRILNAPLRLISVETGDDELRSSYRKAVAIFDWDRNPWMRIVGRHASVGRRTGTTTDPPIVRVSFRNGRDPMIHSGDLVESRRYWFGVVTRFELADGRSGFVVLSKRLARHLDWNS